jgi:hypothetical protein
MGAFFSLRTGILPDCLGARVGASRLRRGRCEAGDEVGDVADFLQA